MVRCAGSVGEVLSGRRSSVHAVAATSAPKRHCMAKPLVLMTNVAPLLIKVTSRLVSVVNGPVFAPIAQRERSEWGCPGSCTLRCRYDSDAEPCRRAVPDCGSTPFGLGGFDGSFGQSQVVTGKVERSSVAHARFRRTDRAGEDPDGESVTGGPSSRPVLRSTPLDAVSKPQLRQSKPLPEKMSSSTLRDLSGSQSAILGRVMASMSICWSPWQFLVALRSRGGHMVAKVRNRNPGHC